MTYLLKFKADNPEAQALLKYLQKHSELVELEEISENEAIQKKNEKAELQKSMLKLSTKVFEKYFD
jgi:hypothetical protein